MNREGGFTSRAPRQCESTRLPCPRGREARAPRAVLRDERSRRETPSNEIGASQGPSVRPRPVRGANQKLTRDWACAGSRASLYWPTAIAGWTAPWHGAHRVQACSTRPSGGEVEWRLRGAGGLRASRIREELPGRVARAARSD